MRAILALTVLSVAAGSGAVAQGDLPRVFVSDTSVKPGDPQLVWFPTAVSVAPVLRGGMRLVYPDSLRRRGISGSVMLEFVVDTLGRVEPGIRVLRTDDPLLVEPAKQTISEARFVPGQVRGRAVRVLVQMGVKIAPRVP